MTNMGTTYTRIRSVYKRSLYFSFLACNIYKAISGRTPLSVCVVFPHRLVLITGPPRPFDLRAVDQNSKATITV